jgi:hypothetical protein
MAETAATAAAFKTTTLKISIMRLLHEFSFCPDAISTRLVHHEQHAKELILLFLHAAMREDMP